MSSNLRRIAQHFRVGPARRGLNDPSYQHLVEAFEGNGLRPYSPCHLQASVEAGGNHLITWIRRTRIDGDAWELPEVPLGEEAERYSVQIRVNNAWFVRKPLACRRGPTQPQCVSRMARLVPILSLFRRYPHGLALGCPGASMLTSDHYNAVQEAI